MADLRTQVSESAELLKNTWTGLTSRPSSALPTKCYEQWTKRASLYQTLEYTTAIFPAQDTAWAAVEAMGRTDNVKEEDFDRNLVKHGEIKIDFAIARHLALTSYVATTWSIYDRLANVCGRLTGIAELAEHPKQNPKPCEDFLGKKDTMGFASHFHIKHAYAWPLRVTYKIRNWLVHEGFEESGVPMFSGDRIADGFRLHDNAVTRLEGLCEYNIDNGKIGHCCLSASEECWATRELLTILAKYHAEVDTMFSGLVKWSVDSFIGQISSFTSRDRP